ncbi:hypothetical protein CHUAL_012720 [Chamberlinius hualienensis]
MGSLGVIDDSLTTATDIPPFKHEHKVSDNQRSTINWEKYGLAADVENPSTMLSKGHSGEWGGSGGDDDRWRNTEENELFAQDQNLQSTKPWWKTNFFLSEPILFGTWDGVFTTCMINIFGVIVFLRSGWMVAEAGIALSLVVIIAAILLILVTVFSAIGICSRCKMERGGVYFMISYVLGARCGGAIGFIYCFGQAVGSAINIIAFGQTIGQVFNLGSYWAERGIGAVVLVLLTATNLLGVTHVIKMQFVLLLVMLLAALDFTVGSFVREDRAHGVDGYYSNNFWNNSKPAYSEGNNWFTIFGVFFPTLTGVLAGINMSGDLKNPSKSIPAGTLAAIGLSGFLYVVFVMVLGATCQRWALRADYMIAEKVSAVGFLLLAGLYISSLSSSLGGLFGTPRVLQTIGSENVIPFLRTLGGGRGPNNIPVLATLAVGTVTLIFVLIGEINTLAPIAAMPFLLTYIATEYAYFSLAMTFDIQKRREERLKIDGYNSPTFDKPAVKSSKTSSYGTVKQKEDENDLDKLFPERKSRDIKRQDSSPTTSSIITSPDEHSSIKSDSSPEDQTTASCSEKDSLTDLSKLIPKHHPVPVSNKGHIWYDTFSNRWLSFVGVSN